MIEDRTIRSDIAWSTSDQIEVRGKSLPDELLGKIGFGDMAYFQLTGNLPNPQQSIVFNAILVTLVEHGLTPSAIAARLTYTGAPESLQSAVAAGLCGLGSVFVGSMEGAARMLSEALPPDRPIEDLGALAEKLVQAHIHAGRTVPGLGHPLHKPIDPRTPRLFQIADENGLAGNYVKLMQKIGEQAQRIHGRVLPINATGALGALCCELGFSWTIVRGFGVMARAAGLVGHILEESQRPMAREIWRRVDEEATAHIRPIRG